MPIQLQWELATSSFRTVNELRELIGIASQPNVQPQVILAAENLGFGLIVSRERIQDAIGALGGNDSIRLESIQGHIGLRSGDLQRIVRQSTSLLQFFLTITACKPCFTDSELGDLAFSLMDKTKVLRRYPVSSTQLMQFIQTLSGHSELIVPIVQMSEIAIAVANEHPSCGDLYDRLSTDDLANLLVHTFEGLADQDVIEMKLTGHTHAVWLATLFSWLLPDATHIIVGGKSIKGITGTKLTLEIEAERTVPWELEIFKSDTDVTKYVFDDVRDEIGSLHRLPLCQAKYYFNDHYLSTVEDPRKRQITIRVMGELARILTIFFCEHGQLLIRKDCCQDKFPKCMAAPMTRVMGDSALSFYANAIEAYGWDNESQGDIRTTSRELQILLEELVVRLHEKESPKEVLALLHDTCSKWVTKTIGSACDASYVIDPATFVALDATVTSTLKVAKGTRYLSPLTAMDLERTDEIVGKLLSREGLDIQEFRKLAFTHLLPGLPTFYQQDLIVNYGGYTVSMDVLWNISTQQSRVLGIRYTPGHIDKDGIPISRVRESDFNSYLGFVGFSFITLFENGIYKPPSAQSPPSSFETRTSTQGDQLIVKHYIKTNPQFGGAKFLTAKEGRHNDRGEKASWIGAIYVLALATHIGRGYDLTVTQEREMARRLDEKGLKMIWQDRIPVHGIEPNSKILLRTSGVEKLRFFSASPAYDHHFRSHPCFMVVVRHNAPILSCIQAAEDKRGAWAIIS